MSTVFSGPMFMPGEDDTRKSSFGKSGAHYNIFHFKPGGALKTLRAIAPDEMNFWLFSTSGVHGTYATIEEIEAGLDLPPDHEDHFTELTVLLVQPRIVSMTYGVMEVTRDIIEFLKDRRKRSHEAVAKIGVGDE